MYITEDFEKVLEDNAKAELEWVVEEFSCLFKHKQLRHCYTKEDITMGNKILDNVIGNIKENNSEQLLNLLTITLNKLERSFPEFF
ncbi:MAG: hypothetical protein ACFFA3_05920 [Promethearchaeota archaeon]